MLHLKCTGQEMKVAIDERIADKYINANKVHFEFCERWSGMVITAQFTQKQKDEESGEPKDKTYNVVVDDVTGTVTMPNEIMAGEVFISAFGEHPTTGVRITSIPIKKTVDKSGFVGDGDTPIPPTPDLYAQLVSKMGAAIPTPNGANKQLVTNPNGATVWVDQRILSVGNFASGAVVSVGADKNVAHGTHATALGSGSQATGASSAAIGSSVKAPGSAAFACNSLTKASGKASFAKGNYSEANGENSSAEGLSTVADGANQHVQGKYNVKDTAGKYAHIVGNGETNAKRSNAHTLDWDGNAWFKGKVYVGGTSMDDAVELGTGGEVDEDAVREIVEEALTAAKENGEFDGEDGYSPTVTLTRKSNGVQIDVQNKDGKQSATVYDGQGGEGGGGLPTGGDPNMMLVTDADGNAEWQERTHYEELVESSILPADYSLIYDEGQGIFYLAQPFVSKPVAGNTYKVVWNGTPYNCVAQAADMGDGTLAVTLGNGLASGGDDTGEPFAITVIPDEMIELVGGVCAMIMPLDGSSELTLDIIGSYLAVHKIDEKYLPSFANGNVLNGYGIGSLCSKYSSKETGEYSVALGENCQATGYASTAIGSNNEASCDYSYAIGHDNTVKQIQCIAIGGKLTIDENADWGQTVVGQYNAPVRGYAFIVGWGTSENPKNIFTVSTSGNGWFRGTVEGTALILKSSTSGSSKRFKITVDDSGTITATAL